MRLFDNVTTDNPQRYSKAVKVFGTPYDPAILISGALGTATVTLYTSPSGDGNWVAYGSAINALGRTVLTGVRNCFIRAEMTGTINLTSNGTTVDLLG
jgi:hypothetical protein